MPRSLNPKLSPCRPWVGTVSLLLSGNTLLTQPALAQNITVAPDGTNTTIAIDGNTHQIQGGTRAGSNLFHAFQDFGLSAGETANFWSDPSVSNILGRVTGGSPSIIDGLIQVSGANSNLYLMNPAGMVFGANASLNVGGDFTATTADRIGFGGGWFNAAGSNDYTALVGTPNQLAFWQENPGAIVNQGNLTAGQNISLIGGTVVNEGRVVAAGGQVAIAAVPGERLVNISQPGMLLSLEVASGDFNADITPVDLPTLLTGSGVEAVSAVEAGDFVIRGEIVGEQVDLYAAGQVTPSDPGLIQGDTRVIRFSETGENPDQAVFIDARADDPETLLYGAAPGTIAQIITNNENGIEVVTEQLAQMHRSVGELDSIAIVAEGNGGNFWLGDRWIQHENIANYQAQLQTWGQALSENADLLLYSCFTALGATGEALINSITDMTGLDVAASVDLTGSTNHGGNWALEASAGHIEANNPFTAETVGQWDGKLNILTVNSATDDGSGFTLRDALNAANNDSTVEGQTASGIDTILFDTSIDGAFASATTIAAASGEFTITEDVIIEGAGQTQLTITGGSRHRVFNSTANHVTFNNLTIADGTTTGNGGGIGSTGSIALNNVTLSRNSAGGDGGGVYSSNGAIAINNSAVINNRAAGEGGGIAINQGSVMVANSTISGNVAGGSGGGVSVLNGAAIVDNTTISGNSANGGSGGGLAVLAGATTVRNTTVTGNSARLDGGGIHILNGITTLQTSTLSGNTAGRHGGGIAIAAGTTTASNITISGNSAAGRGGAIASSEAVNLRNTTIAFNSAGTQGGGLSLSGANNHNIVNTIVASNQGVNPDIAANLSNSTVESSLIQSLAGITGRALANGFNGNIIGRAPLLKPLANNGGSTQTHALAASSPARNAGNNSTAVGFTDQRGETRILGGQVDIGAFEYTEPQLPLVPPSSYPSESDGVHLINQPQALLWAETLGEAADEGEISVALMRDRVDELLARNRVCDALETADRHHTQTFKRRGGALSPDGSPSCLAMQHRLPNHAMLVSVIANRDRLSLMTLTAQDKPVSYQLPISRASLLAEVAQLQTQLTNPLLRQSDQFLASSQELYRWLIEPLLPELRQQGIRHLLFSLDEGLRMLPIAALHNGDRFLIEDYSVNLIPSLSLTPTQAPNLQDASVLALGISQFEQLATLPAVPVELSSIQTHFPKSLHFQEEQATLAAFQQQLNTGKHRIVHLATHGHFQPGVTDQAYIQFWGDRLNLNQVEAANWSNAAIDLLVLSACKTALGDAETEYGFAGLAVQARAGSAVAGLWNAHDAATSALMSEFYRQLSLGQPKGEALRLAQLALLEGSVRLENKQLVGSGKVVQLPSELQELGDRTFWHPYYWSGFTLIGNPW